MTRHNFTKTTKKAALARSGGRCEAVGERYGKAPGVRCSTPVAMGAVQFDHYPRGAHDPHPDTRTLGNCTACCPACNQYAANHTDKTVEAKMKRVQIFHGLREPKAKPKPKMRSANRFPPKGSVKMQSRGFEKRQ